MLRVGELIGEITLSPIKLQVIEEIVLSLLKLQMNGEDGLVSVADVYPQVRLHPNTELAALVLWPIDK